MTRMTEERLKALEFQHGKGRLFSFLQESELLDEIRACRAERDAVKAFRNENRDRMSEKRRLELRYIEKTYLNWSNGASEYIGEALDEVEACWAERDAMQAMIKQTCAIYEDADWEAECARCGVDFSFSKSFDSCWRH